MQLGFGKDERSERRKDMNEKEFIGAELAIIGYSPEGIYHRCRTKNNEVYRIDLQSCGCLPENTDPRSLIGKSVRIAFADPFLFIADGVEIL